MEQVDGSSNSSDSGSNSKTTSKLFPRGYLTELKYCWRMAWPLVLIQLTQAFLGPVSIAFSGRLSTIEFDAVSLANSMVNITVVSTAIGLATACDTIFSQTFGDDQKHELGACLQKSLLVLTLVVFPVWTFHINAQPILVLLGQDPEVASLVENFLTIFMPGTLGFFLYISAAKFLQTQNIVLPNVVIGLIINGINALLNYIFVNVLEMRTSGCAIAMTISYCFFPIFTAAYILYFKVYEGCWSGWSRKCLYGWGSFAKFALFGFLMICVEFWSFEATLLISGAKGTTELGAQSVIFQFESIWFQIPFGTGIACSILIGQHLGAGNGKLARATAWTCVSALSVIAVVVSIIVGSLKDYLPLLFTSDPAVVEMASSIIPVLAIFYVVDVPSVVGTGVMRGCGRQKLGSVIVIIGYVGALCLGIPLLFTTDMGIIVLWIGLVCALIPEASIVLFIVYRTDWDKEVKKAKENVKKETQRGNIHDDPEKEDLLNENGKHDSYMSISDKEALTSSEAEIPRSLLIKRGITVLIFFIVFIIGIFLRVLIPRSIPEDLEVLPTAEILFTNETLAR